MAIPQGQEVVYGGPYMEESEAIEAELLHAHNENREPDLWGLFKDKQISRGGVDLIQTHLEGHPNAGYEGEKYYETIEAHGVPIVEKPSEDYVFPGEGGVNTVDDENPVVDQTEPSTPPTLAPTEESSVNTPNVGESEPVEEKPVEEKPVETAPSTEAEPEPKLDSVIADALSSVEESPFVETIPQEPQGRHAAPSTESTTEPAKAEGEAQ